tara:strand:+ start:1044 stop:1172 length:129 start_codon:yes stop_codon:yes gene_type:complete
MIIPIREPQTVRIVTLVMPAPIAVSEEVLHAIAVVLRCCYSC